MRKRSLPFFISWMISSGVIRSRSALVSAAGHARGFEECSAVGTLRIVHADPPRASFIATPPRPEHNKLGMRVRLLRDQEAVCLRLVTVAGFGARAVRRGRRAGL